MNLESYFKENERILYRDRAKEMFYHGYNNYMNNAYPYDELDPIGLGSIILWPIKYTGPIGFPKTSRNLKVQSLNLLKGVRAEAQISKSQVILISMIYWVIIR